MPRGRPKKTAVVAEPVAEDAENVPSAGKEPKKRGRPGAKAMAAVNSTADVSLDLTLEPEDTPKSAKKGRRSAVEEEKVPTPSQPPKRGRPSSTKKSNEPTAESKDEEDVSPSKTPRRGRLSANGSGETAMRERILDRMEKAGATPARNQPMEEEEPKDEEEPKKEEPKRRGRKPKVVEEAEAMETKDDEEEESKEPEVEIPKRRGRKPKAVEVEAPEKAEVVKETKEAEVPKRRGRKPKVVEEAEEKPEEPVEEAKEQAAPKRRGRKPKAAKVESSTEEAEPVTEETEASVEVVEPVEKPEAPKRRGRKPKAVEASMEEEESTEKEASTEVAEPAEEAPEVPKRRGRQPKAKPEGEGEPTAPAPKKGKKAAKKAPPKKIAKPSDAANAKTTAAVMERAKNMAEPSSNKDIGAGLTPLERMEAIRQRNIQEKMEMLKSLGLMDARDKMKRQKTVVKKAEYPEGVRMKKKRVFVPRSPSERRVSQRATKGRKSYADMDDAEIKRRARKGEGADGDYDFSDSEESEDEAAYSTEERKAIVKSLKKGKTAMGDIMVSDTSLYKYQRPDHKPPDTFGHVSGVPMGEMFISRMEASYANVHRPPVSGIAGSPANGGAYSICLSGGGDYSEDLDFGYFFTFSGAGGRDLSGTKAAPKNLRCAPQSRHQELEGVNLALSMNVETGRPVRVIRGFRLHSKFAPTYGYRYDGLYTVAEWRWVRGNSGFKVITFALKRVEDQEAPPWEADDDESDEEAEGEEKKEEEEEKEEEGKEESAQVESEEEEEEEV